MVTRLPRQQEIIKGRETEMTKNSHGAFVFAMDDWKQLERFLVLGTEGGAYYIKEEKLTQQNALALLRCLKRDGRRVIELVTDISVSGRAYKNNPALFALALATAHTDVEIRRIAFAALPKVARTATHLFTFAHYMQSFRGWGKAARRAIGQWYTEKNVKNLAYQMIKYQQRDGWTHRDMLRLAHPIAKSPEQDALFRWAVSGNKGLTDTVRKIRKNDELVVSNRPDLHAELHEQVKAFEEMKKLSPTDNKTAIELIEKYDLPREAVSTHFLNDADVWNVLLKRMPMTAVIRNLGTMSKNNVFSIKEAKDKVLEMLSNKEHLMHSRVHPMQVLIALKTYDRGKGILGKNVWTTDKDILSALDKAFYKTFANVTPTGKRILLALDVSGSMGGYNTTPIVGLTAREVTAAMSLITLSVEENAEVVGFQDNLSKLDINPKMDLTTIIKKISGLSFGSTNCSAPFAWAKQHKKEFDLFSVYTDNETDSGYYWGSSRRTPQPSEALKSYRASTGIPAKLVVVATAANNFSIADPKDAGMLDICGFDGTIPSVISDFAKD